MMHPAPLPFPITPTTLVWGIYVLVILAFILLTLILLYHWIRYAEKRSVFMVSLTTYTAVSSFLIALFSISTVMLVSSL